MLNWIDDQLNRITMYRLVLYYLLVLFVIAVLFSTVGILGYSPLALIISATLITAVCWLTNEIFSRVFGAQTNTESVYITAFILVLIITPPQLSNSLGYLSLAIWASIWAMASKYIFAIGKKHLFNPAAFAVALTAITINQSASWWVGTLSMAPFVLAGGLLVAKKLQRFDLVISFFIGSLITILGPRLSNASGILTALQKTLFDSAELFFAFVMITEPLTTPPSRMMRITYGGLVGLLFAPWIHLGSLFTTPELALLVGNVFSYLVSPKQKLLLTLKSKRQLTPDTYDFVFQPDLDMKFRPGHYLEWTLAHPHTDSRGNRRYFTIASSPTEKDIVMGVKFYPDSSSYKKKLLSLQPGDTIIASQLAGEFLLPQDPGQKLVLVAGGIGITPFRSMIQYLIDRNEKRPITLLYSNKTTAEIAYKDIFDKGEQQLGIKAIYCVTEEKNCPPTCHFGRIDAELIRKEIPDYRERTYYVSGPLAMTKGMEKTLKDMGVKPSQIRTDFFPGFV